MRLNDPRDYQILFLSLFLVLGIGTRDWTIRPGLILVVMATCLLTQWITVSLLLNPKENLKLANLQPSTQSPVSSLVKQPNSSEKIESSTAKLSKVASLKSAMITALSLSLLLRADHYTTMIVAGSLAILSKFLFQVERQHFFNPANFGIIAALILTNDAWVSPGQWGDDGWYALLFLGTGGMVLKWVGRWDTTAAFLGTYTWLEAIRNFWLGWTWDVFCHRLMNGSLLLFALFMITDPRSIPNARISRIIWAGCIAILTFILQNYFFVSTAVFWALFALAPFSIILNLIGSDSKFEWNKSINNFTNDLMDKEKNKADIKSIMIR